MNLRVSIPHLHDFTSSLNGCTIFSSLDLKSAFFQIRVNPDDRPKTCIATPFGNFMYNFMPFGLRNASATFQRLIDHVLRGLPFVYAYICLLYTSPSPRD